MSITKKIWGIKNELLKTDQTEIDLLYLERNSACSIHHHKNKLNRFIMISGSVSIRTDLGTYNLVINEPFDVIPPMKHQFIVHEESIMIETAFVKTGKIDANDIERSVQGGLYIDGIFLTLDELKENNWL